MRRITFILLSILLTITLPGLTIASEKQYRIEMIVFSHLNSTNISQEVWSQQSIMPINLKKTITLAPDDLSAITPSALTDTTISDDTNTDIPTHLLPDALLTLNPEQKRLQQHSDYRVLTHIGWQQSLPDNAKDATVIHFYGGDGYSANGAIDNFDLSQSQPYKSEHTWQVNGTLQLYADHYINSRFNVAFSIPTSELQHLNTNVLNDNTTHDALSTIILKQSRRMKSNELNYIDHPAYGILIKVTPVTMPPATT